MLGSSEIFNHVTNFEIGTEDFSVHLPLYCSLQFQINNENMPQNTVIQDENNCREWFKFPWKDDYKDTFLNIFRHKFEHFNENVQADLTSQLVTLNDVISQFTLIYQESANKMKVVYGRKKRKLLKHAAWWDNDCEVAKSTKYRALRKFRNTNSRTDLQFYKTNRNRFKALTKRKKINYHLAKRQTLVNSRKDPRKFWNLIKQDSKLKSANDADSPQNIPASEWKQYFSGLFGARVYPENQGIAENISLPPINRDLDGDSLNSEITFDEIRISIFNLHSNRSPGPDGICVEMFKHTINETIQFLHFIFNYILDSGEFPEGWGESIICPLHKKGDRSDPGNYRAIALINSMCKIFTNILNLRLIDWCETNDMISESQAGFRRSYSTIDNAFTLQALVQKYLSKKKGRFYCIFIDFEKAFDCIDHAKLWESLQRKHITGKYMNILQSMYNKLKSCVRCTEGLTEYFDCKIGTRQGCQLSPVLFCLFINDLHTYLQEQCDQGVFVTEDIADLFALMFADDVASFADTVFRLQQQINCIESFCKAFRMVINMLKTKVVVFRRGGIVRQNEKWFYGDTQLEVVSFYKYLGLFFTPKLVWSLTTELLSKQALKATACIFSYQWNFGHFSPNDIFKLFDSMVTPILTYGAEIWGYEYRKTIESVQAKFCKRYCGLSQTASDKMALGECGRLPLCVLYMVKCVRYWVKLLQMPSHRYPKQCYLMLKRLDDVGRQTWATRIRMFLYSHGFGYAWVAHEIANVPRFVTILSTRLKDMYTQLWLQGLENSPKAEQYKQFKSLLETEKYLNIDMNYKFRRILSRFRCSDHTLLIETGRHVNLERQDRLCPVCAKENMRQIETEFHFFCECPAYNELRGIYLNNDLRGISNTFSFNRLMSSKNERAILDSARFLYFAFEERKRILSQ